MLKLVASDLAVDLASAAVQVHGGYGYIKGSLVERLYRDAKLTQIWEGTNEIQRVHIGRSLSERHPRPKQADFGDGNPS